MNPQRPSLPSASPHTTSHLRRAGPHQQSLYPLGGDHKWPSDALYKVAIHKSIACGRAKKSSLFSRSLRLGTRCSASRTAPPKPKPTGHTASGKSRQASPTHGFHVPSYTPSDIVSPGSTLRRGLVRVWPCRKIHLYGESKKSTHDHQTHLPSRTHQTDFVRFEPAPTRLGLATGALAASQAPRGWFLGAKRWKPPLSPLETTKSESPPTFFFPSYTPSDIVSPHSTLRWGRVRERTARKIHLYGKSKKSTHGHQTHLPSCTHHSDFDKISIPLHCKRPANTKMRPRRPRRRQLGLTSPPPHPHHAVDGDDGGCTHRAKHQDVRLDELFRMV